MESRSPSVPGQSRFTAFSDVPTYSSTYIRTRLRELFQIDGKDTQIEVLQGLLVHRQDTILLAKTGFGKSILFQAPPLLLKEGGIAIILMPLLALEAEQHCKIGAIPGSRPCVLNGDTNSPELRMKIRSGTFTHSKLYHHR